MPPFADASYRQVDPAKLGGVELPTCDETARRMGVSFSTLYAHISYSQKTKKFRLGRCIVCIAKSPKAKCNAFGYEIRLDANGNGVLSRHARHGRGPSAIRFEPLRNTQESWLSRVHPPPRFRPATPAPTTPAPIHIPSIAELRERAAAAKSTGKSVYRALANLYQVFSTVHVSVSTSDSR